MMVVGLFKARYAQQSLGENVLLFTVKEKEIIIK